MTLQQFRDSVVCKGRTWTYPSPDDGRWVAVLESGWGAGVDPRSVPDATQFKMEGGGHILVAPSLHLLEDKMWELYRKLAA